MEGVERVEGGWGEGSIPPVPSPGWSLPSGATVPAPLGSLWTEGCNSFTVLYHSFSFSEHGLSMVGMEG